ncbi:MAG: nucleotidyl transferase AbiEii/AbiGii toxin family protein [Trueperaceae bacterium]
MPFENFLCLDTTERREIIEAGASTSSWSADVLEKDVWVVWCLDALFRQPSAPDYAFKGGTSLSKVYAAIDRFSEDVDITVSTKHPSILGNEDPLAEAITGTHRKRLNERAATNFAAYLREHLAPYLEHAAATLPEGSRPTIIPDGEAVHVAYPSVLPDGTEAAYLRRQVLLEFGTRGTTEPREEQSVATYLEGAVETTGELAFPNARVMAMSAERTFWEKATLVHAEITRDTLKIRERYARHWYDLYRLSHHETIGAASLAADAIFVQVIGIKAKQFRGGGIRYEDCGRGRLRLVPDGALLTHLKDDYRQMRESGMFLTDPPAFAEILEHLADLEQRVNSARTAQPIV